MTSFLLQDPEYNAASAAMAEVALKIRDRKFVLYRMAQATRTLTGDTAECGCYKGGSSFLICLGRGARGPHHIFDSFEGLSQPGANDGTAWHRGDMKSSLKKVRGRLQRFPWVEYHAGWIPDRFPDVAERQFALVHIDVDLYGPTRAALEFFYPRLVPGGFLVCDDYAALGCPGATQAFDEFIAGRPEERVIYVTSGQGFVVKRP